MRPIVALLLFALVIVSCRSWSSINVAVVYTTMLRSLRRLTSQVVVDEHVTATGRLERVQHVID